MSIQQNFSAVSPSLSLNFARSKQLDSRITFTRSSTATYMDSQGLIRIAPIDSPRFDHSYNSSTGSYNSLGLLLEESRVNYILNSNSVASWSAGTFSEETTNPIKGLFSTRVTNLSTDGDTPYLSGATLTAGTYTVSHYIDTINSTCTSVTIFLFGTIGSNTYASTNFDFTTKLFTTVTYFGAGWSSGTTNAVDCGNGIYRISLTATSSGATTVTRAYVAPAPADTSYLIIAGTQIENGAFPTSYIPTSGSTVTRSADRASITGTNFSSWFNPIEGTINITYKMGLKTSSTRVFQINNSSTPSGYNVIDIVSGTADGVGGGFFVNTNNVSQGGSVGVNNTGNENTIFKVAGAYKENDLAGVNNKTTEFFTDNVATLPTGLDRVVFSQGNLASLLCGHLQQVSYYPKRLSNDQLQTLTK
jgi:hypothetical protein